MWWWLMRRWQPACLEVQKPRQIVSVGDNYRVVGIYKDPNAESGTVWASGSALMANTQVSEFRWMKLQLSISKWIVSTKLV